MYGTGIFFVCCIGVTPNWKWTFTPSVFSFYSSLLVAVLRIRDVYPGL
jgi:hypothetical protein